MKASNIIDFLSPDQGQLPLGPERKKKLGSPLVKLVLIVALAAIMLIVPNKSRRDSNVNHPADPNVHPTQTALRSSKPNSSSVDTDDLDAEADDGDVCALTLVGLEFIVEAWKDGISNSPARQAAKKMFYTNLNICTSNTQSEELFATLKKAFLALSNASFLANDGEIACEILPALVKKLVEHPLCADGTISVKKKEELVDAPCVNIAYMTTFAKIRENHQHEACKRNLDGIKSLISSMNNVELEDTTEL